MSDTDALLERLTRLLEARKTASPETSYVASLYAGGHNAILAKVEEESSEVLAAGAEDDDAHLIHEVADLWFHCMVLLVERGLRPHAVLAELERRFGTSGLVEKASRTQT